MPAAIPLFPQATPLPLQTDCFSILRSASLTPRDPKLLWRFARYALPGSCTMVKKSSKRKKIHRTRKRSKPRARAAVRVNSKKSPRYVYYFGDGHADGAGTMKPLLGGKGANLHEMTRIGLPVPPGFTIDTDVCTYFYDHNRSYPAQLEGKVSRR